MNERFQPLGAPSRTHQYFSHPVRESKKRDRSIFWTLRVGGRQSRRSEGRSGVPRMARVVVPKYPHSVVERGHNRQVVIAFPHVGGIHHEYRRAA
jgi:hypothetical protein